MTASLTLHDRQCGDCSLCCKLLPIRASDDKTDAFPFDKPPGEWCKHCMPGQGCKVWNTGLPRLCQNYACMWKKGLLPENCKPNKIHAIFDEHVTEGIPYALAMPDLSYPEHPAIRQLIARRGNDARAMLRTATNLEILGAGATDEERKADEKRLCEARNRIKATIADKG